MISAFDNLVELVVVSGVEDVALVMCGLRLEAPGQAKPSQESPGQAWPEPIFRRALGRAHDFPKPEPRA